MKLWELLLSNSYGILYLVNDINALASLLVDSILCAILCREAQHGNLWISNTCH
ncbi:Uncharacterised protein [Segatella copri]|nr:Uncharacterised protein [Segatella copri]